MTLFLQKFKAIRGGMRKDDRTPKLRVRKRALKLLDTLFQRQISEKQVCFECKIFTEDLPNECGVRGALFLRNSSRLKAFGDCPPNCADCDPRIRENQNRLSKIMRSWMRRIFDFKCNEPLQFHWSRYYALVSWLVPSCKRSF